MSNELKHLVFVYGSLKRGQYNHRLMLPAKSEFIGKGHTLSPFLMYDGSYPRVANPPGTHGMLDRFMGKIVGEVWRVNDETLACLDALEGHPHFYCREKVAIRIEESKRPVAAWVYVYATLPHGEPMKPVKTMLAWRDDEPEAVPQKQRAARGVYQRR